MAKRERTQLSTKHRIVIKINTKVPLMEQEMLVIQEHLTSPRLFCWFVLLNFSFLCNILRIIVCHSVLFLLTIVLSVIRFTASDDSFWYFQNLSFCSGETSDIAILMQFVLFKMNWPLTCFHFDVIVFTI